MFSECLIITIELNLSLNSISIQSQILFTFLRWVLVWEREAVELDFLLLLVLLVDRFLVPIGVRALTRHGWVVDYHLAHLRREV